MKTHPHLLVRDALAAAFVRSVGGDAPSGRTLDALLAWSRGESPDTARLHELRAEDGDPLFDPDGALSARFAALEDWARDRAVRFAAAREWVAAESAEGDVVRCARAAWDAGLFFEVHELVEPAWLDATGPAREPLQGLIMAGAALHHLSNENLAGARGLLRDASRRLQNVSGAAWDFPAFGEALGAIAERIDAHEVRTLDDLDELPRLEPLAGREPSAEGG